MSAEYIRQRFLVSGLVQQVGFRYWTAGRAEDLGVRGYVRNLPDGRVEVIAEGTASAVAALGRLLRQGPPHARVKGVSEIAENYLNEFTSFTIRY